MNEQIFKIVELLDLQQGQSERGEWKSQEVILEEVANVQYPDRFLVAFRGDKVEMLQGLQVGDHVVAHWSAMVRQYKTKETQRVVYAQHLNGWKIEKAVL